MTHFISSNFACNLFVKACQMEKTFGSIPSNTGVVTIFEEKCLGTFAQGYFLTKPTFSDPIVTP